MQHWRGTFTLRPLNFDCSVGAVYLRFWCGLPELYHRLLLCPAVLVCTKMAHNRSLWESAANLHQNCRCITQSMAAPFEVALKQTFLKNICLRDSNYNQGKVSLVLSVADLLAELRDLLYALIKIAYYTHPLTPPLFLQAIL